MCSCSGNCNCNSTTIPRGPQGPTGAAATIAVGDVTSLPSGSTPTITNSGTSNAAIFNFGIPAGAPGANGTNGAPGINGKNAYTFTADFYTQPNFGDTATFDVSDVSWMSVNQIIFVGNPTGTSNIGGYYKVTSISPPFGFEAIRLDWSIPGVTYTLAGNDIPPGAIVQASGTIGATSNEIEKVLDETSDSAITFTTGSTTAELDWLYDGLTTNQDTLSFEFEVEPNSGNGRFNFITFSVGSTVVSSFTFSGAGGQPALLAAKINYSFLPTGTTPGYVSSSDEAISEDINFIRGFVRITRSTSTGVDVKVEYLMCNKYVQRSYGSSQETFQVQKHFIGTKRISGVPNLDSNSLLIEISAVPENMNLGTYGAEITIKNAIKLSSIL